MILICRPKGRGNWKQLAIAIEYTHLPQMLVKVGEVFTLGGVVFRIAKVLP